MRWKRFPHYITSTTGNRWIPITKGQQRVALISSTMLTWIICVKSNQVAGDLRRHDAQVTSLSCMMKWVVQILILSLLLTILSIWENDFGSGEMLTPHEMLSSWMEARTGLSRYVSIFVTVDTLTHWDRTLATMVLIFLEYYVARPTNELRNFLDMDNLILNTNLSEYWDIPGKRVEKYIDIYFDTWG